MGIDLTPVEHIVISHGHADHTGGLMEILERTGKTRIIAHPDVWALKYSVLPGYPPRKIGIPFSKEELEQKGGSIVLSKEPVWLTDHIVTTGEIPMVTGFETIDANLCVEENGRIVPDQLWDDRGIIIKTDSGLILFSGCAHRGIVNMLHHACEVTGMDRAYAVIGGTHLVRSSEERVYQTIEAFRKLGVSRIGVSHCTGQWSSAILAREFGSDIFFFNNAGTKMELMC
jgi:7,8-dihydropterin-6-yl-methyl-4-(beta-D-ribofuranosyl)aminobenzene 5'-phosphate synthase